MADIHQIDALRRMREQRQRLEHDRASTPEASKHLRDAAKKLNTANGEHGNAANQLVDQWRGDSGAAFQGRVATVGPAVAKVSNSANQAAALTDEASQRLADGISFVDGEIRNFIWWATEILQGAEVTNHNRDPLALQQAMATCEHRGAAVERGIAKRIQSIEGAFGRIADQLRGLPTTITLTGLGGSLNSANAAPAPTVGVGASAQPGDAPPRGVAPTPAPPPNGQHPPPATPAPAPGAPTLTPPAGPAASPTNGNGPVQTRFSGELPTGDGSGTGKQTDGSGGASYAEVAPTGEGDDQTPSKPSLPLAPPLQAGTGLTFEIPGVGPVEAPTPQAKEAVLNALRTVGMPYVWGGKDPEAAGGVDCSGLTQWAYGQEGVDIPPKSFDQSIGAEVPSEDQLRAGDLIVWNGEGGVGHVAMYLGEGKMLEANGSADQVRISDMNTSAAENFKGFYRPTG